VTYVYSFSSLGGLGALFPSGASASLERSLGGGRWLVLGVSLSGSRSRNDPGLNIPTREDVVSADLTAGVRMALTEPGAPVELSALLLGDVGAGHLRLDRLGSSQVQDLAWVGASAGLAVQRELLSNLSLRLSSTVVRLDWQRSSVRVDGGPAVDGSSLGFGLALQPSLELRLAF
jgi:hypothetical protein